MRRLLQLIIVALALPVLLLAGTLTASAHPMGNFSINHFSALTVERGEVRLLYVVDLAEIPTFQELGDLNATHSAALPSAQRAAYLAAKTHALMGGLSLRFNGRALPLTLQADDLIFPPGAGGLPTERLYLALRAPLPRGTGTLAYADANFPDRAGWKEIVARAGNGERLNGSSAPAVSRSQELTIYPQNAVSSPPQDVAASLSVAPAPLALHAPAVPAPAALIGQAEAPLRGANGAWSALARRLAVKGPAPAATSWAQQRMDALSALIAQRNLSPAVIVLSLLIAAVLGALHAFSPGHGKTVVGAYIVGSRATAWHAVVLGLTVTITHTAGVFALGLVTLWLSHYIVPDHLYPWLGALSGLFITAIGLTLGLRRLAVLRKPGRADALEGPSHDYAAHDGAARLHHAHNGASQHHHSASDEHAYLHAHGAAHLHPPDGRVAGSPDTAVHVHDHSREEGQYVALGS